MANRSLCLVACLSVIALSALSHAFAQEINSPTQEAADAPEESAQEEASPLPVTQDEAKSVREEAERELAAEREACGRKFFVNNCRNAAYERYLEKVELSRKMGIEARRVEAEQRKAGLEARRAQQAIDMAARKEEDARRTEEVAARQKEREARYQASRAKRAAEQKERTQKAAAHREEAKKREEKAALKRARLAEKKAAREKVQNEPANAEETQR
jgi:hypothetical protein